MCLGRGPSHVCVAVSGLAGVTFRVETAQMRVASFPDYAPYINNPGRDTVTDITTTRTHTTAQESAPQSIYYTELHTETSPDVFLRFHPDGDLSTAHPAHTT